MERAGRTEPHCYLDRILRAVAARDGVDPIELPPSYDSIDPEALEAVIDARDSGHVSVEFAYSGYEVTVTSDNIRVRDLKDSP